VSDLLGGAGQSEIWIGLDNKRAMSERWLLPYYVTNLWPIPNAPVGSQRNQFWPGAGQGMALMGDAGDVSPLAGFRYEEPDLTRGSASLFGITGVTRDAYGQPLPFVTVKLYHTSDDLVQCITESDGNGNFLVSTHYYPDGHYLVFYQTGSPDIFATSQNTLVAG
jgi:hypothetical protein